MEEMATWDMIFNKTNYGKTGNECALLKMK